jgi:hypothetical protein
MMLVNAGSRSMPRPGRTPHGSALVQRHRRILAMYQSNASVLTNQHVVARVVEMQADGDHAGQSLGQHPHVMLRLEQLVPALPKHLWQLR